MGTRKYRFLLDSNPTRDVLGGAVEVGNAAFTATTYLSGPALEDLKPGEYQTRKGLISGSGHALYMVTLEDQED